MMDEAGEINAAAAQAISDASEARNAATDTNSAQTLVAASETKPMGPASNPFLNGEIRTLDGDIAGDEFAADAINYQVLLGKIDSLLERLKLDA